MTQKEKEKKKEGIQLEMLREIKQKKLNKQQKKNEQKKQK